MRMPIQVLIYLYRQSSIGHEYLMMHRVPDRREFWQGVSGGVEETETPMAAAVREVTEETGLMRVEIHDLNYSFSFPLDEYWRSLYNWTADIMVAHVFTARVPADAQIVLSPEEHSEYCWSSFDEAMNLLFWPEDKEALRKAAEFIRMQVR